MNIAERITRGRQAEYHLNDEYLNSVFDAVAEKYISAMISLDSSNIDGIMENKRRVDALYDLRREMKIHFDDGQIALHEEEMNNDG